MNPNVYWMARAPFYYLEQRLQAKFYRDQESGVMQITTRLNPRSILEIGCNYGRITGALRRALPDASIKACDLSAEAIGKAHVSGVEFFVHDLYSAEDLPAADLCIAIEVFLHHPTEAVRGFVRKALRACHLLLHEYRPGDSPYDVIAPHCFHHDYAAMYQEMDLPYAAETIGEHSFIVVAG